MRGLLKRIAALEQKHRPLALVGMLEGADRAEALSRATRPGIYMHAITKGDTIELLIIDRIAGRLEVTEVHAPPLAATPASE